jgi:hypothetical protein
MSLEAPPPSRRISSTPISVADASRMLETYLTNSESHPHLHPDALVTPTGINFSSHGGSMGGVLLHNLRRVAAGLRGEYLEPEKTPEPEEDEEGADRFSKKGGKKRKTAPDATTADDWEPLEQFERDQGNFEIGEVGDRDNFAQEGAEEPAVEVTGGAQQGGAKKQKKDTKGLSEKEARKLAKKEKNQQRKRDEQQKRELKNKEAQEA